MIGVTQKQHDLLDFIKRYKAANDGVAPNFDEMRKAAGLVSKSGVHRLLIGLEERGLIVRLPHRARAVHIITETPFTIPSPVQISGLPEDLLWELDRRVMAEIRRRKNKKALAA